jgi:hypothetical protein
MNGVHKLDIEGVVIFETKSGIPLYSKMKDHIDPNLFSSFVAAIGHFSRELKLGGLSSFSTEEKVIFLAATEKTITALITPKRSEYQVAYQLAANLGAQFEDRYEFEENIRPEKYNKFTIVVDDFMRKMKHPFLNRVAIFIHEQYGGEISIKPKLMKENGSTGEIDILVKVNQKKEDFDIKNSASTILSDELTFVKAVDNEITRGEILDFIDSTEGYGTMKVGKEELVFQPYFPSRAIIIGREYSDNVFEFLGKLPKEKGKPYIDGSHVYMGMKMKELPKESRCYLELWKWHDDREPELVYG